jgi:hypothetical protein
VFVRFGKCLIPRVLFIVFLHSSDLEFVPSEVTLIKSNLSVFVDGLDFIRSTICCTVTELITDASLITISCIDSIRSHIFDRFALLILRFVFVKIKIWLSIASVWVHIWLTSTFHSFFRFVKTEKFKELLVLLNSVFAFFSFFLLSTCFPICNDTCGGTEFINW